MFLAFNSTFGPLLVIGFLGMPRRSVTYAGYLHGGNTWVSISAFFLGASMLIFLGNFIWSQVFARVPAGANPWGSKSIEWQLPSPVPVHNFDRIPTFGPDPYPYGTEAPGAAGRDRPSQADHVTELATHSTEYGIVEREPPEVMARNLRIAAHLWSSATAFFFAAFLFAYFYLRSLDSSSVWRPKHVDPSFTLGTLAMLALVAAAGLLWLGLVDHRGDRRPAWRVKGAVAIVLLVAAVAFQIVEWSTQGFGPTEGAYASVYLGWTGMFTFFLVGVAFWTRDDACDLDSLPPLDDWGAAGRPRLGGRRSQRARHRRPRLTRAL